MSILDDISAELEDIKAASLWKTERPILSPQSSHIDVAPGREVLNFCANNYLGLADNPELIAAAKDALDSHGLGMASVRFICGTTDLHRDARTAHRRLCRDRGFDPLCRLFRRQWRRVRAVVRREGCDRLRQPQPRLDHRRDPAVEGQALSVMRNGDMDDLERQFTKPAKAEARGGSSSSPTACSRWTAISPS